ncbi:MAG: Vir protein [Legionellaceae bacterium]|nr:Vir protein [Legionellaceae bacterium]
MWRSQFKDEGFLTFAKKEWKEALHHFSDLVLNKAILQCREFYEMPPTLPQMVLCCRQIKKRHAFYVCPIPEDSSVNQIMGSSYLQRCKAILAGN